MVRVSSEYTISASVSPSLWQGPLLQSTVISVILLSLGDNHLGLGGMAPGAFFGDASRAKGEKGVSTKPAALIHSHPNTTGDRARPRLCPRQGLLGLSVTKPRVLFCLCLL